MAIIATNTGGGGDYKPVPAGNHRAICSMVVDLGRQRIQSQMYGESIKPQVYIAWELPDEPINWTDKDGNERSGPMRIGKTYTVSLHENANLRSDLENWRGRPFTAEEMAGFDIAKLAGVPCLINVTHKENAGKTYANVTSVTPLPKAMERPTCSDGSLVYDDEHLNTFEFLPDWLKKKIQEQVVEQKQDRQPAFADDLSDEIPF
jgi:hypothetical protein